MPNKELDKFRRRGRAEVHEFSGRDHDALIALWAGPGPNLWTVEVFVNGGSVDRFSRTTRDAALTQAKESAESALASREKEGN